MMDKRLLALVPEAMCHVILSVAWKWAGLLANVCLVWGVASVLTAVLAGTAVPVGTSVVLIAVACVGKAASTWAGERESFAASQDVKRKLRRAILEKLLRLGPAYDRSASTAEVVQLSVEGCEQLETYFGQYLPQLFYSVLAPVTLFIVVAPMDLAAAFVLLVFVPLIPLTIVAVQKIAKRILSAYWDRYTQLGDSFLENLEGLTTLKIYSADEAHHKAMNKEAEHFRIVTMKVLSMQLNSIVVMDIVALGGAAAGIWVALSALAAGSITLFQALAIVLLSADFFLPMRQLGSFFHVAMNGIAASGKIFRLLELPEPEKRAGVPAANAVPALEDVSFSYDGEREVLHEVTLSVAPRGVTAIVGLSGSGKSTIAALMAGCLTGYAGHIRYGALELSDVDPAVLAKRVTTVGVGAYLFSGTVRENLLMAKPEATDEELWAALEAASLAGYLRTQDGLDTQLTQDAQNLSGGQRQRLAFARAYLHGSAMYVFDEATSNIDAESESVLLASIFRLAADRPVVMIAHRLANVVDAERIYVMDQGRIVESGTHEELLAAGGTYARMRAGQQELEAYGRGGERG
ncbi:ABC transporter ATP-binding protein/permease [Olsenella sp. Marseille-P4559]|uniref:ABC transporter ATP-binding protein/permease n=1 Tax=Olsenella sp. Marseille-P4559 TaxID=2364795 RepID=UPI0010321BC2|nr:ABC transporter ATP-binding protein/permease [Olsenella sp. Marseille-P4559]